jgi:riboflavin kinase / FMN adenylyltransferase
MKVIRSLAEDQTDRNSVVTVGTFDGVHCAHREIIREVTRRARERKGRSVVITFDPHPKEVVSSAKGSVQLLTTIDERIAFLEQLGVDLLLVIRFTFDFSRISAEAFYKDYIVNGVGASEVVVGYDHMFGRDRQGSVRELADMGRVFGFSLVTVPPYRVDNEVVSSTRVRKALAAGAVEHANELLGHPYALQGVVVEGDRRGATLGFPTANVRPEPGNKVVPGRGVYIVRVGLGDSRWYGMMNIGVRPTIRAGLEETLEVHILDFQQNIYGEQIHLEFLRTLRGERKFGSLAELTAQLEKDRGEVRRFVAGREEHR